MSTWNCLAPTFIDGSPAPPNTDPRTIQWVYGEDSGGTLQNTIGQALGSFSPVIIGGVNNTVRTVNGYIQPIISPPLYKGELSQTIFIPATCRAGEYYDVYLRDWNKCNVYGVDLPVFTTIRILVVASPGLPTDPSKSICFVMSQHLPLRMVFRPVPLLHGMPIQIKQVCSLQDNLYSGNCIAWNIHLLCCRRWKYSR